MRLQLAAVVAVSLLTGGRPTSVLTAEPNDNRVPGGTVTDSGLTLAIEARRVMWYPDGDSLPGRETFAFAEVGKAPLVPGPLLRVRTGTTVRIRIHNPDLPDTLRIILHPLIQAATGDPHRNSAGCVRRAAVHRSKAGQLLLSRHCDRAAQLCVQHEGIAGGSNHRRLG